MKIKALLIVSVFNLIFASAAFASSDDNVFKPNARESFQVLLAFLDANADTKFTDYDKRTQKEYEGDIGNYITYAQEYKKKFKNLAQKLDSLTKQDLENFLEEVSREFQVVEAVLREFKRVREKRPNKIMNQVLIDFVNMFVLIIKTLEASVESDTMIAPLRERVQVVEKEVGMLTGTK